MASVQALVAVLVVVVGSEEQEVRLQLPMRSGPCLDTCQPR
jgi:hypothetical protein